MLIFGSLSKELQDRGLESNEENHGDFLWDTCSCTMGQRSAQLAIMYSKGLELFVVVFISWKAAGSTCWGKSEIPL